MILQSGRFLDRCGAAYETLRKWIAPLGVSLIVSGAALPAQAVIDTPSTGFSAAESGRSYMDVGGVWDGSTEVTGSEGDTFTVTYFNDGDATAYDFSPRVELPAGFSYVTGTALVSVSSGSAPSVSTSLSGNDLIFDLGSYDLAPDVSITLEYDLKTATTVSSGTYQLRHNRDYALTEGGTLAVGIADTQQNILVQEGAATITASPKAQVVGVSETATFTVSIRNTGLGALFDVALDESLINPGNNLQLTGMTQTSPALSASANVTNDVLTLPYLAPGDNFTATVAATVTDCGTIINVVSTYDRTGNASATDEAPVELDLHQPLVTYSAPSIVLDYNNAVPVVIPIENAGLGNANDFSLQTNFNELDLTISSVGTGWSYNASTGLFTLTGNDGSISDGTTETLTFMVEASDICVSSGAGTVFYTALYTNPCGDAYAVPDALGSVSGAPDTPSVSLSQSVDNGRIAVGDLGAYTITLSASNLANLATDPIVVTETLDDRVIYAGNTPSVGSVSIVGQVLTWTVDQADLSSEQTLVVDFMVDGDPCNGGGAIQTTASLSASGTQGCSLDTSAGVMFLAANAPGAVADIIFNVTPASDGLFETGSASADNTQDLGEGEFIPFEAIYSFGVGYPGTWADTIYTDDFGGVTEQTLVPGSLTYQLNGGAVAAIPSSAYTTSASGLRIDFSFLGGDVEGDELTINYATTVSDDALSGASRAITQRAVLALGGVDPESPPAGVCVEDTQTQFTQPVVFSVGRAAVNLGLDMDRVIEACGVETLRITVDNANVEDAHNVLVTLLNDGTSYSYVSGQTPVYGGIFNSGNITYSENGGDNPSFEYTAGPLTGEGTIDVQVFRRASSPIDRSGFSAEVEYDSSESAESSGGRIYSTTATYTPLVVRRANLALTVTPGSITVVGDTIRYSIFLTNTDSGAAYGSTIVTTLPDGFIPEPVLMDAANTGDSVSVSGQEITWNVGALSAGATVQRTVIASVDTIPGCSITIGSETIQAYWGCGDDIFEVEQQIHPSFFFPRGQMQVVHDSTNSFADLCDEGVVEIIVRNTGAANLNDITVTEILPSAEGLTLSSGSVEYRINGGSWQSGADPSISGDTHVWTSAQIPPLAKLVPQGQTVDGVDDYEVRIRFNLEQSDALAGQSPELLASANANLSCGSAVNSPGVGFDITVFQPRLNISKTGRNITANPSAAFSEVVYGGVDDVIEWRVVVTNSGNQTAENVQLSDNLTGSGSTAVISGGSLSNVALAADTPVSIDDLSGSGGSQTYIITEVLGGTCVTAAPAVSVTWGCDPGDLILEPGDRIDSAEIVMEPDVDANAEFVQELVRLPNGRARVDVTITNNGGTLMAPYLEVTLPSYLLHDTTGAVTLTESSSDISSVSRQAGSTDAEPVFEFTGGGAPHILRYGETIAFSYYVRSTVEDAVTATSFPDLASVDTTGNSRDPANPSTENIISVLNYENSCGGGTTTETLTTAYAALTPDLDITAMGPSSGNLLISDTNARDYTFTVTNNGPSGSVADQIYLSLPNLGTGWTVNSITLSTPGTGGTGGTIATGGTFSPEQVGTLNAGQSAVVTVNAQYSGTPGPLTLNLRVRGEHVGQDGTTTFDDYSLDERGQRIIGATVSLVVLSTSETESIYSSGRENVYIGEEVTYRMSASFFGADGDLTNVVFRNTPADNNGPAHTGLSYISHLYNGDNEITIDNVDAPTPGVAPANRNASRIDFEVTTLSSANINSGAETFSADVTVRVLNLEENTDEKLLRNNFGVSFQYLGQTFRSNNGDDGFSGGTSTSNLHIDERIRVQRPSVNVVKTVRNVTSAGAFDTTAIAQAGDVIEYRIIVEAEDADLFDLEITDNIPSGLILQTSDVGADTNGDDTVDVATTGVSGGDGVDITFNASNTAISNVGDDLDRLDENGQLTFLYRVVAAQSVNPSQTLDNTVTVEAYSITRPSGNQTAPLGTEGDTNGSLIVTATDTVPVIIESIEDNKEVIAFAADPDGDSLVYIGEQLRYRLTLDLPQGTVPNFTVTDLLPDGLLFIGSPTVTVGSDISAVDSMVFTASGQELEWDFGEMVTTGVNNTVTIEYSAQVRNITSNTAGTVLTNEATYNFTGIPVDETNFTSIDVTVAEPDVSVTHEVRNVTRSSGFDVTVEADAGDVLEYRVVFSNPSSASRAPAYDLSITETLPVGLSYVENSTTTTEASGLTGTLVEPDISGQVLTWGREQSSVVSLDLGIGSEHFEYRYRVSVDDTIQPLEELTNGIQITWTSLDGNPGPDLGEVTVGTAGNADGERTGSGGAPNAYSASADTTLTTLNSTTLTKTKSGDTLPISAPADGFRVGDVVTYALTMDVMEGTLNDFVVEDALPSGLVFLNTVSILPTDPDNEGFSYTMPVAGTTAPSPNATGTLTWDFGDLVHAGDNNESETTLVITYRARVVDASGVAVTPTSQELENSATLSFELADASTHTTDASIVTASVLQPELALEKAVSGLSADSLGNYVRRPGETISFSLTVTNTGDAPAYNTRITDTIPEGMRGTAPTLSSAQLNGANVTGSITTAAWDSGTGEYIYELNDAERILPGETLVLTYELTIDNDDSLIGTTISNEAEVNQFYSLPSGDAEAASRRSYDPVGPERVDVTIGIEISGSVYYDLEPNGVKDLGENWSGTRPTVYANLVTNNGSGFVYQSITVPSGSGDFTFTSVPAGTYRIVISNSATNTSPSNPSGWSFYVPTAGMLSVTANSSTGDLYDRHFGLFENRTVSGRVFQDNGLGGVANDGEQSGSEVGIGNVRVRLLVNGSEVDSDLTKGSGDFTLLLPPSVTAGDAIVVEELNPPNYVSTGASVGDSGGVYSRSTDQVSFTMGIGSVSGIAFGDVPENALLTDGAQTILPGASAIYRHSYTAGTGGEVTFSLSDSSQPSLPWTALLFLDTNCNGAVDGGDSVIEGVPVTVAAGEEVCLIVRVIAPNGAPHNAKQLSVVSASFNYSNASPAMANDVRTRQDVTTVGTSTTAGLQLTKSVDKASASPGEVLTYTITYTNAGSAPLEDLYIDDKTPAYTTFLTASSASLPDSLTGVSITNPSVGETGSIRWTFTGTLNSGASSTVEFTVQVDD